MDFEPDLQRCMPPCMANVPVHWTMPVPESTLPIQMCARPPAGKYANEEEGGDLHDAEQQRASPARAAGKGYHSRRPPVLPLGLLPQHAPAPPAVLLAHSTACTQQLALDSLCSTSYNQQFGVISWHQMGLTQHGDWQSRCSMANLISDNTFLVAVPSPGIIP